MNRIKKILVSMGFVLFSLGYIFYFFKVQTIKPPIITVTAALTTTIIGICTLLYHLFRFEEETKQEQVDNRPLHEKYYEHREQQFKKQMEEK